MEIDTIFTLAAGETYRKMVTEEQSASKGLARYIAACFAPVYEDATRAAKANGQTPEECEALLATYTSHIKRCAELSAEISKGHSYGH